MKYISKKAASGSFKIIIAIVLGLLILVFFTSFTSETFSSTATFFEFQVCLNYDYDGDGIPNGRDECPCDPDNIDTSIIRPSARSPVIRASLWGTNNPDFYRIIDVNVVHENINSLETNLEKQSVRVMTYQDVINLQRHLRQQRSDGDAQGIFFSDQLTSFSRSGRFEDLPVGFFCPETCSQGDWDCCDERTFLNEWFVIENEEPQLQCLTPFNECNSLVLAHCETMQNREGSTLR